eukprot:CAMPEP_0172599278 /NCGR_PEP_ID=MMETSP1068-20121228/19351_1 /TAXON_ID=35684 /ORGANISM="Pseudopedinella elastica, Strain CCMP716" /LENGTH=112 /DNA_ID=CAMNT_0013399477 /DNA_START=28 /DNA_END=362 /DNA_ORIENTATION=+
MTKQLSLPSAHLARARRHLHPHPQECWLFDRGGARYQALRGQPTLHEVLAQIRVCDAALALQRGQASGAGLLGLLRESGGGAEPVGPAGERLELAAEGRPRLRGLRLQKLRP